MDTQDVGPLGLSKKQGDLLKKLYTNRSRHLREFDPYTGMKKEIFFKQNPSRMISISYPKLDFYLHENIEIDLNVNKVTTKFCRGHFHHVPKQITSFAKFIKEVADFQTKSIILPFTLQQDPLATEVPLVEVKASPHDKSLIESPGGIMWVTFYDNDTKAIIYEYYPQLARRRYNEEGRIVNIIQYKPKVIKLINDGNRVRLESISTSGIGNFQQEAKEHYLELYDIPSYRYKSINNMQANPIGNFDKALV